MPYVPTMSLLTHTETHAFKSFLSSMEYSDSFHVPEWNMYGDVTDLSDSIIPHTGKDSLRQAAKSLMSLDTQKWDNPHTRRHHDHAPYPSHPAHQYLPKHFPTAIAPLRTVSAASPLSAEDTPSASSSPESAPLSASPRTPFELFQPPPPPPVPLKRPSIDDTHQALPNKRPRPSPHRLYSPQPHASSSSTTTPTLASPPAAAPRAPAPAPKPALLSPSQKKANHIQSEQKRRANIRRGYEALCDAVPALREAILLEEEGAADGADAGARKGKGKARGRTASDDAEKTDGRAGPRSENVVLQKTIDYMHELLEDRQGLLARLHAARGALPFNHPLVRPHARPNAADPALWEREWTGGVGTGDDDDEGDDD